MESRPKPEVPKTDTRSDAVLLGIVDETLEEVFKGVGVKVIYASFEKSLQLKRNEIITKPEVFSAGLERLLGSAATVIEKLIIKNLQSKLGLETQETKDFQFSNCVHELKDKIRLTEKDTTIEIRPAEEVKPEKTTVHSSDAAASVIASQNSIEFAGENCFELLKSISDSLQIGLDVWHLENIDSNANLTLILSNQTAEQITGLSRKASIGKSLPEVFPRLVGTEFQKVCEEVVRSGKVKELGKLSMVTPVPQGMFSLS